MQSTTVSVRVLYGDVDQMGVVHHAHYLRYFEAARTEFLRRRGLAYADVEKQGWILPVHEVSLRYRLPARYDELLEVTATLTSATGVRAVFTYEVRRAGDPALLTLGTTTLACCTPQGRPTRMPPALREALERDEGA